MKMWVMVVLWGLLVGCERMSSDDITLEQDIKQFVTDVQAVPQKSLDVTIDDGIRRSMMNTSQNFISMPAVAPEGAEGNGVIIDGDSDSVGETVPYAGAAELQAYSTASYQFVGTLQRASSESLTALVQTPMQNLFLVRAGQRLGNRSGWVTEVGGQYISIQEAPHPKADGERGDVIITRLPIRNHGGVKSREVLR